MALTPGQLSYWRKQTGNPKLTMAQAVKLHDNAVAKPPAAAPAPQGVKNPPAQPFLTGEQLVEQGQAQQQHDQGYQTIADQLAQLALNNQYQKQAIEQGRVKGVAGVQDDAAARGVFNSSIKDAGVYDVTAQAATAQQHLIDNMAAAQTSATANRAILENALKSAMAGFNQAAVENAAQIDTGYSQPAQPAPNLPQGGGLAGTAQPGQPRATNYLAGGVYHSAFGNYGVKPAQPKKPKAPVATGGHPQKIIHIH